MDTIDMTSAEIRDYNSIISEVNSASLDSLLEDGTTYNQLLSQWEETIALNDKISDLNTYLTLQTKQTQERLLQKLHH